MDTAADLEPDVEAALGAFRAAGRLPFEQLGVEGARQAYCAGRHTTQLLPLPMVSVSDLDIGTDYPLPTRLYRPHTTAQQDKAPAILFFHGGGWVIGDLDTHDSICRALAIAADRTLIAIDYRRAPEHRFPAAMRDALTAFQQVVTRADALGIDPGNIALAGDSAGGTMAAVVAYHAMREIVRPIAQLLFYPVTDLRGGTASYARVTGVPITAQTMHWFRGLYLAKEEDAHDWRTSPLLAPDLANFPPTFITTAGHDPLCDEGIAFAQSLTRCGVPVEHRHLPGQIHGYLTLGRLIGEATRSITAAAAFLKAL